MPHLASTVSPPVQAGAEMARPRPAHHHGDAIYANAVVAEENDIARWMWA